MGILRRRRSARNGRRLRGSRAATLRQARCRARFADMGVDTFAIFAHTRGTMSAAQLAALLDAELHPAFWEALHEVAQLRASIAGGPPPDCQWYVSDALHGPAVARSGLGIMLCGQVVKVQLPARWRGFLQIAELREPLRVVTWALAAALRAEPPIVYCSDQRWTDLLSEEKLSKADAYALAQRKLADGDHATPPRRLSTVFRGWGRTRTEQTRATFEDLDPRDPLAVHWHVRAQRIASADECLQEARRGARGPLPDSPTQTYLVLGRAATVVPLTTATNLVQLAASPEGPIRAVLNRGDNLSADTDCSYDDDTGLLLGGDQLLELTRPDVPSDDGAIVAFAEQRFEALRWYGQLTARYDGILIARWTADEGDPGAPAVLEIKDAAAHPIQEATPAGLMRAVARIIGAAQASRRPTLQLTGIVQRSPVARLRIPASVVASLHERGGSVHASLCRDDEPDLYDCVEPIGG